MENHQFTKKAAREEERKKGIREPKKEPENITMSLVSPYLLIIILNVNGFNSAMKSHRVAAWINKQDPTIYFL